MTETPETPPTWQPGMRRKRVRVQRPETTVIDGRPSTRMVTVEEWVTLPPRDWDEIIRRGATGVAVVVTLLAAAGTTASVGGLLGRMLHPAVGYAVGAVFTASWLVCLGIEHIERVDAARAARARTAGWVMLLIGMGAVITYGYEMGQLPAGVVGSCLDLAAKGLWWLIMGLDRVNLAPGVAHWVAQEEQHMAGRFLLGTRLARLKRRSVQMAGAPEFQAAEAILAQAAAQAQAQLPAADASGQAAVPAAVPVSGPVPDPSAPASPMTPETSALASAPASSGPVQSAPASAQVPTPPLAPSAPAPSVPSAPVDDARTRVLTNLGLPLDNPGGSPAPSAPSATPIGTPTIAAVVRTLTTNDPGLAHVDRRDELIALAAQQLPQQYAADEKRFAATVKRNLRVKAS